MAGDSYPDAPGRLVQQAKQLEGLSAQLRESGDVRQVLITAQGAQDLPSVADELWLIHYNLLAIANDL